MVNCVNMSSPKTFALRIFLVALVLRLLPVLFTLNLGIGLDDQDRPLPEATPEIHTYELLADGPSL